MKLLELKAYSYLDQVLFADGHTSIVPNLSTLRANEDGNEAESALPEDFFEAEEIFSNAIVTQEAKGHYDTHTDHDNLSIDVEHKEVFRDTFDDRSHKEARKMDFNVDAVKDIALMM